MTAARRLVLLFNRIRYHLFFVRHPGRRFRNSKRIAVLKRLRGRSRKFLVFLRCGADYEMSDDGAGRNFDLALNPYAEPARGRFNDCEYLIAGGVNKYKAAFQFIDDEILDRYDGVVFLDDDLEISHSQLSGFLDYCCGNALEFAQPSLKPNSFYSHSHLLNKADTGWRRVHMIEVMCPYFSSRILKTALPTFDLSYSTWGLDYLWPKLPGIEPVVVDAYMIRHTRQVNASGPFYRYMRDIGVSPGDELDRIRNIQIEKLCKSWRPPASRN